MCAPVLIYHACLFLIQSSMQLAVSQAVTRLKQGKLSKKIQIHRCMPPSSVIDDVRKSLKFNKKQFLNCWEVLIFLGLDPVENYMEDFVSVILNRVKDNIIGKDSGTAGRRVIEVPTDYDQEMSFVMHRSRSGEENSFQMDENQTNQEEQLRQLVDDRVKEIKLIAEKVSMRQR